MKRCWNSNVMTHPDGYHVYLFCLKKKSKCLCISHPHCSQSRFGADFEFLFREATGNPRNSFPKVHVCFPLPCFPVIRIQHPVSAIFPQDPLKSNYFDNFLNSYLQINVWSPPYLVVFNTDSSIHHNFVISNHENHNIFLIWKNN